MTNPNYYQALLFASSTHSNPDLQPKTGIYYVKINVPDSSSKIVVKKFIKQ